MNMPLPTPESFNNLQQNTLPGLLGVHIIAIEDRLVRARMEIATHHRAPNGFLHAASVIALADTCCGYGCIANLPDGAKGFTTVELKSNHLGTALEGTLECEARAVHLGRSTQVWDATVSAGDKTIALFRCTQIILR